MYENSRGGHDSLLPASDAHEYKKIVLLALTFTKLIEMWH